MTTQSGNPVLIFSRSRLPKGRRIRPRPQGTPPAANDGCYWVSDPETFSMSRFADEKNLFRAFKLLEQHGGHGAGNDGFRPEHFSNQELWPILRTVSKTLKNGSYRPHPPRICRVSKRNGGTRELSLFGFIDRTVAKALLKCLKPFWGPKLVTPSTSQIFARLHRTVRAQRKFAFATDDIRTCYDSVRLNDVMDWHRHHIREPRLLELIERIIRGNDSLGTGIGLPQGSPYSPTAMELVLHHCLDLAMDDREANTSGFRYVDNLAYLCPNVNEGVRILSLVSEVLEPAGLRLKGDDGEPQDLRDPEYNRVFLGLIPRWKNGLLTFSIPELAFETLTIGLQVANETPNPAENAFQRCVGWLQQLRPALMRSVERQVVDRVVSIARHSGFRNVNHRDMLKTAASARKAWHQELERNL